MTNEVVWADGKLVHAKVAHKIKSKIEKGALATVHALVVHQTGAPTAASTLNGYDAGNNGAHFLIDKNGAISQTARINQKCWHVGKIRSRCREMKMCMVDELKVVDSMLFKQNESYAAKIGALHQHEAAKSYPDRYPTNDDSLGIEIVGNFDVKGQSYDTINKDQNNALIWLVEVLEAKLSLGVADVYTHAAIGYKQPSEGSTAIWKKP